MLTYDSGQFYVGGIQSSGWVALLLGTFYAVIGALHILGDHWLTTDSSAKEETLYAKQSTSYVLASIRYVHQADAPGIAIV